jgi:hypothetical protein
VQSCNKTSKVDSGGGYNAATGLKGKKSDTGGGVRLNDLLAYNVNFSGCWTTSFVRVE